MQVLKFISDQILGMKWLNDLIGYLIEHIFGIDFLNSRMGASIQFFIYDFIKISILLSVLIFIISYIQSYFPPERTKKILGRVKGIWGNVLGALLGTLTPFCSCSSIPLFIGFTRAGLSTGVTFSFLISSPLVDLGAFILLASVFGFPIALTYVVVGLVLAIIGGTIIDKLGAKKYIEEYVLVGDSVDIDAPKMTKKDRLVYAKDQAIFIYKKVFLFVIIGIGIGAIIHNFIPEPWIQRALGSKNPFSVFLATLIGAPIYADIFGTIPIAEALFAKGVGIGTILAFMMSVTTLSIPSLVLLRKVVKPKLLVRFILIVLIGIILIGYIFNALHFIF